MGYRQKKAVMKSIAIRSRDGRNIFDAYAGYDPITKKQKRFQGNDLKKLKEDIEAFYLTLRNNGDIGAQLKPYEIADARKAYDLIYSHNMKMTLEELVLEKINAQPIEDSCSKKIGEALEEYHASFSSKQEAHRKAILIRVGAWANAFGYDKTLSQATAKDIVDWIKENKATSEKTYNNYLSYIKSFFQWCVHPERAYIKENPLALSKKLKYEIKDPEYLPYQSVQKLFLLLEGVKEKHPEYIAYATLSFFCGIRREEILRMATDEDAGRIDFEKEQIIIRKVKGFTQGRRGRSFTVMPNAISWLKSIDLLSAMKKINEETAVYIYKLARKNKIDIPHNAGRHSFITHHVALLNEPSKTQGICGTSAKMLQDSYMNLEASKADAEAYFSIAPSLS